ncbi:hypothetical protein PLESTF_001640100 [Pleodorina starrii]|nr:hypothetical protein PLESTF_001640100 [Pleodorina starrii]
MMLLLPKAPPPSLGSSLLAPQHQKQDGPDDKGEQGVASRPRPAALHRSAGGGGGYRSIKMPRSRQQSLASTPANPRVDDFLKADVVDFNTLAIKKAWASTEDAKSILASFESRR